jgi:hypothetical protein
MVEDKWEQFKYVLLARNCYAPGRRISAFSTESARSCAPDADWLEKLGVPAYVGATNVSSLEVKRMVIHLDQLGSKSRAR